MIKLDFSYHSIIFLPIYYRKNHRAYILYGLIFINEAPYTINNTYKRSFPS